MCLDQVAALVSSCAGFSDAEMSCSPHALPVGVGEAPRHKVATRQPAEAGACGDVSNQLRGWA
jgi:hypothetical protein